MRSYLVTIGSSNGVLASFPCMAPDKQTARAQYEDLAVWFGGELVIDEVTQ